MATEKRITYYVLRITYYVSRITYESNCSVPPPAVLPERSVLRPNRIAPLPALGGKAPKKEGETQTCDLRLTLFLPTKPCLRRFCHLANPRLEIEGSGRNYHR